MGCALSRRHARELEVPEGVADLAMSNTRRRLAYLFAADILELTSKHGCKHQH